MGIALALGRKETEEQKQHRAELLAQARQFVSFLQKRIEQQMGRGLTSVSDENDTIALTMLFPLGDKKASFQGRHYSNTGNAHLALSLLRAQDVESRRPGYITTTVSDRMSYDIALNMEDEAKASVEKFMQFFADWEVGVDLWAEE